MILKNKPEEVYNYVKNNMAQFVKDGKIKLAYEVLIEQEVEFNGEAGTLVAMNYKELITNSINLKQDIIDTTKEKGFFTFLYHKFKSSKEYYQYMYDNSTPIDLDDDLKDLLKL